MKIENLVKSISGFKSWSHVDKIKFFAWYSHTFDKSNYFSAKMITLYYDILHLELPGNIHSLIASMEKKKPKEVSKSYEGYKLLAHVRDDFSNRFLKNEVSLEIASLLENLPRNIHDINEKVYLEEALKCFKAGSSRAAVVMTWNLAFSHLCFYILNDAGKLKAFNDTWFSTFPGQHKKQVLTIHKIEDFCENLKESETLEIAKNAKIFSGDVYKIMKAKLGRRNSAAHPSHVVIGKLQAEEFIDDLVKNVLMKLV